MHLTIYDPRIADKIARYIERLFDEPPKVMAAKVIIEPRLTREEVSILYRWARRGVDLRRVKPESLVSALHGMDPTISMPSMPASMTTAYAYPGDMHVERDRPDEDEEKDQDETRRPARSENGRRRDRRSP